MLQLCSYIPAEVALAQQAASANRSPRLAGLFILVPAAIVSDIDHAEKVCDSGPGQDMFGLVFRKVLILRCER